MFSQVIFLTIVGAIWAQQYEEERTTYEPEPHPYSFSFVAGRYPGHVDRTRAEYGDGSGIVKGLYTYVDPRQEIRTVEYTADKEGFHATLNIPAAEDTPAVAAAKSRHLKLFNKIAKNNQIYEPQETPSVAEAKRKHAILYEKIAQQHAQLAAELEAARAEAERQELYKKQNETPNGEYPA